MRETKHGSEAVSSEEIRHAFKIYRHTSGRWCAQRSDGLVSGLFFLREAAIRFADFESRFNRGHS
jgi:hypothetical protein